MSSNLHLPHAPPPVKVPSYTMKVHWYCKKGAKPCLMTDFQANLDYTIMLREHRDIQVGLDYIILVT
jgi:hypothetical protein